MAETTQELISISECSSKDNRVEHNNSKLDNGNYNTEDIYFFHSNIRCICVTTEKHGDAVEVAEFISSCITKAKWLFTKEVCKNNHAENIYRLLEPTLTDDVAEISHHLCVEESNTLENNSYNLPIHIIIPIGGDGTLSEVVNGLCTGLTKTLKYLEWGENSKIIKMIESGLTLHNENEMESKNGCRLEHANSYRCNCTNARKSMWYWLLSKEILLKEKLDDSNKNNFSSDFLQKDLESAFLRYFLPPMLYMPAGTGADYAKMELCCKSASEVVQVVRGIQQYISRLIVKQMKSQKNSMNNKLRQIETKLTTNLSLEADVINKLCFHGYEVDIGKVTLLENGRIRYFINECSLGMSVNVVERAERLKHNRFVNWLGGLIIFALSALISLILMKPKTIRVARLPTEILPTLLSTSITCEEILLSKNKNSKVNSFNKAACLQQEYQTCEAADENNNSIKKDDNNILEQANLLTEKNGTKFGSEAMLHKELCQPFAQNGVEFEHFHAINALPTHLLSSEYALAIFASHIVRFTEDHSRVAEQHQIYEHTSEKNTINGFKKDEVFCDSLSEKAFAPTEANRSVDINHIKLQHSKEQKLSKLLSSPRDVRAALDLTNTYFIKNNHGRRCNSELRKLVNAHCCTDYELCSLNNGSCSCKSLVCAAHCNGIGPSMCTDGSNLDNGTKVNTSKELRQVKKNSVNSVNSINWVYLPSSTLCFANGRWYGGGLQVTPHGNPTDGLLSCTNWVTTFWPFILHVLSLYNGKHVEWNHTSTFDGVSFIVDTVHEDVEFGENQCNVEEKSNKKRDCITTRSETENSTNANKKRISSFKSRYVPMSMEADGELIGELPALIEIAGVITFLVPREVQTFGSPIKGTTRACLLNKNSSVCEPSREQQWNSRKTILRRWADKVCRLFKSNTSMKRETNQRSCHIHEYNMERYRPFNEEQEEKEEEELLQSNCINQSQNMRQNINCGLSKNYCEENRATRIVIDDDDENYTKSKEEDKLIEGYKSEGVKTISYGRYILTKLSTGIKKLCNVEKWRSHQCVELDSEDSKTTRTTPSLKISTTKKYENIAEQHHHHHHHHQYEKRQQTSNIKSNSFSKIIGQACDALWVRKRNQHQLPVFTDDGSINYDDHKHKMHHRPVQDNIHVV